MPINSMVSVSVHPELKEFTLVIYNFHAKAKTTLKYFNLTKTYVSLVNLRRVK